MSKLAINLYSIRSLDEPLETISSISSKRGTTPFNSVVVDLASGSAENIRDTLDALDVDVTPAHKDIESLRGNLDAIAPAYQEIGVQGAVIPWFPEESLSSIAAVEGAAADIERIADRLAAWDWSIAYHNYAHEYVDLGGVLALDHFVERTPIDIELDVGLGLVAGEDPTSRIRSLGERAKSNTSKTWRGINRGDFETSETGT